MPCLIGWTTAARITAQDGGQPTRRGTPAVNFRHRSCGLVKLAVVNLIDEFHVFVAVAERGSFSAAARVLRLTPSTVSKLIARIEQRFGVRAFDRTSKAATLTREGEAYLEHIQRVIDAMADVDGLADTLARVPQGMLRIHTMPSFARHQLGPLLPEFMARYPDLRFEFRLGPRYLTLTDDMDIAIQFGSLSDSSLVARKIASCRRILCASPAYIKRHGLPALPVEVTTHQLLSYSIPGRETWAFIEEGKVRQIRVESRVCADQADFLLELARAGMGIARLPEFQVIDDFDSGRLVPVLAENCLREPIYAIVRTRRNLSPRLRVFIDFVEQKLRGARWNIDAPQARG